jgi:hypothetical protein
MILPLPVTLKRFFALECVLIFGMMSKIVSYSYQLSIISHQLSAYYYCLLFTAQCLLFTAHCADYEIKVRFFQECSFS